MEQYVYLFSDLDTAEALNRASLDAFRALGTPDGMFPLGELALIAQARGDLPQAVRHIAAAQQLAQRTGRAESIADVLFALMILGDDRAVAQTYVAGRPMKARA